MNRFISFLNDRFLLPKTGKIGSRLSSLERTIHFGSESFNSDRTDQREHHVLTLDVQHRLSRPFRRPSTLRTYHYKDRPLWRWFTLTITHYNYRLLWKPSTFKVTVHYEDRTVWELVNLETVHFEGHSFQGPSTLRIVNFLLDFENLPATFIVSLGPREFATLETVLVIFLFAAETFFLWTAGLLATLSAWRLSDGFYRLFFRFNYRCY